MHGVVGLVNIGHETTNINILDDGVPVLTGTSRSAPGASRKTCSVSAASPTRRTRSQRHRRSEALDPLLESRAKAGRRHPERAGGVPAVGQPVGGGISRIFTTGGGARIPRLNKVLVDRLRIPVQLANPIEKLQVADGVFDQLPVDEVAPLLMLPIGLALRSAGNLDQDRER